MTSPETETVEPTELSFVCPPELAGHIPFPTPAAQHVPDWFRKLPMELDTPGADGQPWKTMSACLPVHDAFALGWVLPTPFDLGVGRDEDGQLIFQWPENVPFAPVELMNPAQIGADKPPFQNALPLKFVNPWRVKLPPGWSAAFLHPLNHFELPFRIFDAVVDCDVLHKPVDIPFRWTAAEEQVLLPAGTPMVQVVPFERRLAPPHADIRAETPEETAEREAASRTKPGEPSDYVRKWVRRHETEGT